MQTPSSRSFPTRSKTSLAALILISVAVGALAQPEPQLTKVSSRSRAIISRWALPGDPRGLAIGPDGTVYVGLAGPQAVVAVDGNSGVVKHRFVLDSPEIASTKELVTLRTDAPAKRLFIANGSDESASILSLPGLGVLREITIEGEPIRDALPDPKGRYLYLLGRKVHVFDGNGGEELRTLDVDDPMAIAVSADGAMLAVFAAEDFGNTTATIVALFDVNRSFAEISRDPLQTDKRIEAAMFSARDTTLVAFARDSLFEKRVRSRPTRAIVHGEGGMATMRAEVGDIVNSNHVCLPEGSGPQIATLAARDLLVYAERRCSASGTFSGSQRSVQPASLYGVAAYAIAHDPESNTVVTTDRAGFLTVYRVPRPVSVQ